MSEKKPGLLKRLFRFGSKKEAPEPQEDLAVLEANRLAEQQVAEAELLTKEQLEKEEAELAAENAEAERVAAEELVAEKLAQLERLEAERLEAEANRRAEEEAIEAVRLAREEELAELARAEQAAAEKAEARRIEAEQRVADEAERAAAEELAAEEKKKLEEEAAAERARLEAERVEAEKREEELKAKAEQEAEEAAKRLAEQKEAERAAAEAAEQTEVARLEAERLAQEKLKEQEAETKRLAEEAEQKRLAAEEETAKLSEPEPVVEPTKKRGWLTRMREGLSRSSNQLTENITAVFTKRKLDEDTLQDLEDILIQADLGVDTAMNITGALASQRMGKDISDEEVRSFMADEIEKVLDPVAAELELDLDHTPHVILVVGVNGSGKTTTIGKLSQKLYDGGFSTLLVAGDTFRAAAIEQLKIWGDRTQSPVVSRPLGSDAAGLAFDAFSQAKDEGKDVMLMDTAGRLQNKTELMDELEKIIRVLKKQDPTAPHTVLLTLDATTGQNALNQVEIFKDVAGVNGLVMTKMDGTARGGIMVAIANKFELPVYFIGVGEQVDDLEPFEAREFARSIAGLED